MPRIRTVSALSFVLLAGGCAMFEEDTADPGHTQEEGTEEALAAEGAAFLEALGRVPVPEARQIAFTDIARLMELSEGELAHPDWGPGMLGMGLDEMATYAQQVEETLGVDVWATRHAITAGTPPETVGALLGGHDGEAVAEAARAAGWEGEEVLSREMDVQEPLTVWLNHIRAEGEDVLHGRLRAQLDEEPSPSAAEDEDIADLAACLGDVVAALVSEDAAVGVRPADDGSVTTTICVAAVQRGDAESMAEQLEEGRSSTTGQPYAQWFTDVDVELLDSRLVRAEMTNTEDAPSATVFRMAYQRDLPRP